MTCDFFGRMETPCKKNLSTLNHFMFLRNVTKPLRESEVWVDVAVIDIDKKLVSMVTVQLTFDK